MGEGEALIAVVFVQVEDFGPSVADILTPLK